MLKRCSGKEGNSAVEIALITPLILSLIGGSIDFGAAYAQRTSLAMAAKAGAEAAAQVLVNRSLDSPYVPADAARAAVDAVRSAARELDTGSITVRVEWAGPTETSQRQLAPYEMRLRIPVVENTGQTVDARHAHSYNWSYPTFSGNTAWPAYQPGVWYLDRFNWSYWPGLGFWSGHWYPDRVAFPYFDWPNGLIFGSAAPVGWLWGWWWTVTGLYARGFNTWDAWRQSDWRWAGNSSWVSGSPYDVWRRRWTDAFGIIDRYWTQSGWGTGSGTGTVGGPVLGFTYGVRSPDRDVVVQSLPVYQTLHRRPLRVSLAYPFRPLTPLLAPVLRGRTLHADVTVVVTGTP